MFMVKKKLYRIKSPGKHNKNIKKKKQRFASILILLNTIRTSLPQKGSHDRQPLSFVLFCPPLITVVLTKP